MRVSIARLLWHVFFWQNVRNGQSTIVSAFSTRSYSLSLPISLSIQVNSLRGILHKWNGIRVRVCIDWRCVTKERTWKLFFCLSRMLRFINTNAHLKCEYNNKTLYRMPHTRLCTMYLNEWNVETTRFFGTNFPIYFIFYSPG